MPRLWGANTTRAGCTGRRLLKLCRVSVLLLAVVVGSGSLVTVVVGSGSLVMIYFSLSFQYFFFFSDSSWPFQFFPFNVYKLFKVP